MLLVVGVQRRDHVLRSLERHSIEARPVWKPMHLQPLFRGAEYFPHAEGDDVSARLWQRNDGQWYRAKSCDGFYPCGPALVTVRDHEVPAPVAGVALYGIALAFTEHHIKHGT